MKLRVYEIHLFKSNIETASSSHHDDDRANPEKVLCRKTVCSWVQ